MLGRKAKICPSGAHQAVGAGFPAGEKLPVQIHVPVQAIKKVKIGEVLRFYGREEKGQRAGAIPAPCGGHGK